MSIHDETFDQFYARISADRKAEIAESTDPAKRAELEAWDQYFEAEWRASWEHAIARNSRLKSSLSDDELAERSAEYRRENYVERERSDFDEHSTYVTVNGKVW